MFKAIRNNIPNAITCLNLLCGALAVVAAFSAYEDVCCGLKGYQLAVILIGLGAVADFCDGLVARLLGAVSGIGKELDSLSDLVSFGLAPAMLMLNVLWGIFPGQWWPLVTMLIPVFGALRLARFNVDTNQTTTFTGLPIPANAMFWIGYAWWLAVSRVEQAEFHVSVAAVVVTVLLLSWLMVCDLRMFSLKMHSFTLRDAWRQYVMIMAAILLVALLGVPGFSFLILLYVVMCSVDLCLFMFKGKK